MAFEHLEWSEGESRLLLSTPIFSVFTSRRTSASGKTADFVQVSAPDWVTIIPVVVDVNGGRSFLMVRQYRQGSRRVCLEFPGGIVDPGESARGAGLRELREETGYAAEELFSIGTTNPNPSFMTNTCHFYYCELPGQGGHGTPGEQDLDEHEEVDVCLVPEKEIWNTPQGDFSQHAIMVAAYQFYERFRDRR